MPQEVKTVAYSALSPPKICEERLAKKKKKLNKNKKIVRYIAVFTQ